MTRPQHPAGTRAALYLRKSTDDQVESIDTQRRGALEYAAARGWSIVEEFTDAGVSRAEFKKRPGLIGALNAANERRFDVLLLRDETRLGGDQFRTGLALQDLADSGVDVVYYFSDELVVVDGAVDKFLIAARNFASELEREKISQRTYENLLQKAKAGRPAGGIAYGYRIADGAYVVDEQQAPIVRRIFELYAAGTGQRSIARLLNDEGIASPRAGKRGTGSWAPSAIRAILTNSRYAGEGRYNQTRKLYRGGTKVREDREDAELVTYDTPAIVSSDVWAAVSAKFDSNADFGRVKAGRGAAPKYLLTGLARCERCGGPLIVARRKSGQTNRNVYMCGYRHQRGKSVCSNDMRKDVEEADAAVVDGIRRAITPAVVRDVLTELRAILRQRIAAAPNEAEQMKKQATQLQTEIGRLARALTSTDEQPGALVRLMADKERQLSQVQAQLAVAERSVQTIDAELQKLELEAERRLADISMDFGRNPAETKALLTELLAGERLRLSPETSGIRIRGPLSLWSQDCFASPAGFDTVLVVPLDMVA